MKTENFITREQMKMTMLLMERSKGGTVTTEERINQYVTIPRSVRKKSRIVLVNTPRMCTEFSRQAACRAV